MPFSGGRCALALLVLLSASFARAADSARTPEQLIEELSAAAKKGDADGFLADLTNDSQGRIAEALKSQASLRSAQEDFFHALDERFGKCDSRPND
jgi:hypothetical protein